LSLNINGICGGLAASTLSRRLPASRFKYIYSIHLQPAPPEILCSINQIRNTGGDFPVYTAPTGVFLPAQPMIVCIEGWFVGPLEKRVALERLESPPILITINQRLGFVVSNRNATE
jgi:hypothetical protein